MIETDSPPRHVAVIMDGNGRWAKKRGLPRLVGHNAGGGNIRPVVKIFANYGVRYLTIYMFSTENWNRPRIEVAGLLSLLARKISQETQAFHEDNIRLVHLGRLDRLSEKLRGKVQSAVELTKNNTGLTLCLAFDYGGRDEIVRAARRVASTGVPGDRKSTRLNSSHGYISYAVFCLIKKKRIPSYSNRLVRVPDHVPVLCVCV